MKVCFGSSLSVLLVLTSAMSLGSILPRAVHAGESTAENVPTNPLRASAKRAAVTDAGTSGAVGHGANESGQLDRNDADRVQFSGSADSKPKAHASLRPVSYNRRADYGARAARPRLGVTPRHRRAAYQEAPTEAPAEPPEMSEELGETIVPMERQRGSGEFDQLPAEGEYMGPSPGGDFMGAGPGPECMGAGECGPAACDCGECTGCGCGCCRGCILPCLGLDQIELFAGVQGFTAPLNRGETGSFGFHYGGNWSVPVPWLLSRPIGAQLGYRGTSSNYSGASFSEDTRNQNFITAGLFRRVDWGLQGGVVVDILSEDWYYDTLELTQLRGELSWVFPQCNELGFRFTASTKNNDVESLMMVNGQSQSLIETYEATDLLTMFYRRRFPEAGGGHGRLLAGFTGHGEGLVGTDFNFPLTNKLALRSGFTYLIPKDGSSQNAHRQEAWNIGITLVWYPGRRQARGNDYFRPLFNVADNGSFIVRPLTD